MNFDLTSMRGVTVRFKIEIAETKQLPMSTSAEFANCYSKTISRICALSYETIRQT